MPVIYRCSKCGSILYSFEKVGQDFYGLPTPSELFIKLNGKCPKCHKDLNKPSLNHIKILSTLTKP